MNQIICGGSSVVERPASSRKVEGSNPVPPLQFTKPDLYLEFCSAGDARYLDIRSRHYVVVKGTHGQQLHFLVWYKGAVVVIISGASAVFATRTRDEFFKITTTNRTKVINGIIDNVVFRLENHEHNLGTRVLALWEKVAAYLWERLYGVGVFGFETFILKEGLMAEYVRADGTRYVTAEPDPEKNNRRGSMYKAANWTFTGESSGSAKGHDAVGLTGGLRGGKGSFIRKTTPIKDVYCKWVPGVSEPVESLYKSSWKAGSLDGTPEEKALAKVRSTLRKTLLGANFFMIGKKLIQENK